MTMSATLDGSPVVGIACIQELSVTHAIANMVLTCTVGGLTPGATHTPGISIANTTSPTHTFIFPGGGVITGYT